MAQPTRCQMKQKATTAEKIGIKLSVSNANNWLGVPADN